MAFAQSGLERLGYGLFKYETADAVATVTGSGYFNDATNQLAQFDVIICVCSTGGTPTIDNVFVTSATKAATVTTSATEGVTVS